MTNRNKVASGGTPTLTRVLLDSEKYANPPKAPQKGSSSKLDSGDDRMAAMKPRTGDGPLEVTKEGRGIVMRVPLEGGGRLVVELNADEAGALGEALHQVVG